MDANDNGSRALPKLKEVLKRHKQDSDGGAECLDLEFVYDDADSHANEIAELYSYTEQSEFQLNVKAFKDLMQDYKLNPCWQSLNEDERKSVVMKLLDHLEFSDRSLRMKAARCLLYLAQGCWAEAQSAEEQQQWAFENVLLLCKSGVFSSFIELLNFETENDSAVTATLRKSAVSLADSTDLRVIISVLYIIVEVIRVLPDDGTDDIKTIKDNFRAELVCQNGDDILTVKLLGMVTRFCSGSAPHFPMKKVLLLLWKVILVTLGGKDVLRKVKSEYREQAGLCQMKEDTVEVARTMRASSPPAIAANLLEAQSQNRNSLPFRRRLMNQSSLGELIGVDLETDDQTDDKMREVEEHRALEEAGELPHPPIMSKMKGLPWAPKVRQKDLDQFLESSVQKFIGFPLLSNRVLLAGLPHPIHEGVKVLKQHMYTSLAEVQVQREEELVRNPVSNSEIDVPLTPVEILYQGMLPNLPQYMIALLKILLAATPTSKAKTDSINIMADVLPEEMMMTLPQPLELGIDVNRHKEIIVKAVSGILLLLLKHFKLNHVYQFEFMSQHLVFANCIPLVLKFFNQNVMAYVDAKNGIPIQDFPSCVVDQPELTTDNLEIGDYQHFCWRNMFSCINLLRILNKLTKWKHSRIMMLVVFKSAPILKRTLLVRHALMQVYVLKLLKMQTKYLGRQWRKSNMKTMSAIYQKVRHRLNDDWAFGNDLDARPWDFQAEECALRACVDMFNNRRYNVDSKDPEFEPVDNCITSVLGCPAELTDEFKHHYEVWLQQEVFQASADWDLLLQGNKSHPQILREAYATGYALARAFACTYQCDAGDQ